MLWYFTPFKSYCGAVIILLCIFLLSGGLVSFQLLVFEFFSAQSYGSIFPPVVVLRYNTVDLGWIVFEI